MTTVAAVTAVAKGASRAKITGRFRGRYDPRMGRVLTQRVECGEHSRGATENRMVGAGSG